MDRRVEWTTSAGYRGVARWDAELHFWCGYVVLPAGHPAHGRDELDLWVHGGVTYAKDHEPGQPSAGEWWIGFDCIHAGDGWRHHDPDSTKGLPYVKIQVEGLARQVAMFAGVTTIPVVPIEA